MEDYSLKKEDNTIGKHYDIDLKRMMSLNVALTSIEIIPPVVMFPTTIVSKY